MQIENTFLKVSNLSKAYKADAPPVFEGIDFEIEKVSSFALSATPDVAKPLF